MHFKVHDSHITFLPVEDCDVIVEVCVGVSTWSVRVEVSDVVS